MPRLKYADLARMTERELLIMILTKLATQEDNMSQLDTSVQNLTTAISTFRGSYEAQVADLRAKLAAAQADDATAAEVAADVEENLVELDRLTASLAPATEQPTEPAEGEPTDGAPVDGAPVDGAPVEPVDGEPAPDGRNL